MLDHLTVLLLCTESTAVLDAIAAASVAEFARLEGRDDPTRWHTAAQRWALAGRPDDAAAAYRRATNCRAAHPEELPW